MPGLISRMSIEHNDNNGTGHYDLEMPGLIARCKQPHDMEALPEEFDPNMPGLLPSTEQNDNPEASDSNIFVAQIIQELEMENLYKASLNPKHLPEFVLDAMLDLVYGALFSKDKILQAVQKNT